MKRFLILLAVCMGNAATALATTRIAFEEHAIVASVTARAQTAWFAVAQQWGPYRPRLIDRRFLLIDEDGDGIVRAEVSDLRQRLAIWMVVDLTNGSYAIATPPGLSLQRKSLHPSSFTGKSKGRAHLRQPETVLLVWFVRPGVGAWTAALEDGSAQDGDATYDGNISVLLDQMTPVGQSPPPPDDFERGDIVAAISPVTLTVYDAEVK